jgi:GMP synthase (glutamine-hydrolysing)
VRVLAFRHSPADGLGLLEEILKANGFQFEYADLYASPEMEPAVNDADGLIFLGGSMSANDDLPYIGRELRHIEKAIERRQPVLGICLGAQMVAKALGAAVSRNEVEEIGWAPVTFTERADKDPVLHGLRTETIFHWHRETFDIPKNAELLAYSSACRHQAFRWGHRVYGLQFHLEVTAALITQWCREEPCGAGKAIDPQAHLARATKLAGIIFGRWCNTVRSAAKSD